LRCRPVTPGPYAPAGPIPTGLSAHQKALYRAIDQGQRHRPSIRAQRLADRWQAHLDRIVNGFGPRDFQGQPFAHASYQGHIPAVGAAPRRSPLGNMRKTVHPLRQLARAVAARDRAGVLPGASCTASSAALRARLSRRLRSFSRNEGI